MPRNRRPTHAGSWYTSDAAELSSQLNDWLGSAEVSCGVARAIIAPHAGYSYSGPCAAWAYKHIQPDGIKRVFLLGPSHGFYSPKCLLSACAAYDTPIGSLPIDAAIYQQLAATGQFDEMSVSVDEREHSLEMHLPYIVQVMGQRQYTLVPIMVGAINEAAEQRFGRLLAPYLADPENLFVISSDFCHWGERFGFSYHDPRHGGEIYQSVEALDRKGMVCIECQDPNAYASYQREFNNTICGRHPIAVLLNALSALKENNNNNNGGQQQHWQSQLKFVRYEQSSQARRPEDSSVSYASAVVWEG